MIKLVQAHFSNARYHKKKESYVENATQKTYSLLSRIFKYALILALALVVSTLSWLTAVCATSTLLLVHLHARAELHVHARRCVEAEALGHLDQIQFVDVED